MRTFLRYHLRQEELNILIPQREGASSLEPQIVHFDDLSIREQHLVTELRASTSGTSSVTQSERSFRYSVSNPFWTELGWEAAYQSPHGGNPPEKRLLRSIIPGTSRPSGVIVLGVTKEEKICFIEEFRHTIGKRTLILPRGSCVVGESTVQAAAREFIEETGHQVHEKSHIEEITRLDSDSGILDAEVAVVFISSVSEKAVALSDCVYERRLQVRMLNAVEIVEQLRHNKITDALTLGALMSAVSTGIVSLPL